ncbi:MAG: 4-oxalomesaconate tautomerase [Spirillospora sp.]
MNGVRCMMMRGGTSKGAYFLADDLPSDPAERDDLLLRVMGTPDPRQIDGIGGAHPLTSKVAVVSRSDDPAADVDYLFLQLGVEEPTVTDRQNCGNILAGIGPFAVERGLVEAGGEHTSVRIRMVNSDGIATATFPTPGGAVEYDSGETAISGVPGTAAPIRLDFAGTAGSTCGALLPTGRPRDVIDGIGVTCVDNGMPVVVAAASSFGVTGYESPDELARLRDRVQSLRLRAGELMGLGDVSGASVPKTTLVAPPRDGGMICTRTFIPLRVHTSIGVLGAVTVGTALLIDGAVGRDLADLPPPGEPMSIEHPTGRLDVAVDLDGTTVRRAGVVRTARKLFDGTVFPRSRT